MAKPIGTLGNIDTLLIGGRLYVDPENSGLITLHAILKPATSNLSTTFRKPSATSGYQITTGKTLKISSIFIQAENANGSNLIFAQTDNDVGQSSATALTSPIYLGSTVAIWEQNPSGTSGATLTFHPNFPVLTLKYFTVNDNGGNGIWNILAYGYES